MDSENCTNFANQSQDDASWDKTHQVLVGELSNFTLEDRFFNPDFFAKLYQVRPELVCLSVACVLCYMCTVLLAIGEVWFETHVNRKSTLLTKLQRALIFMCIVYGLPFCSDAFRFATGFQLPEIVCHVVVPLKSFVFYMTIVMLAMESVFHCVFLAFCLEVCRETHELPPSHHNEENTK